VYKQVRLDGTLDDVIRGMTGDLAHNKDVLHWGLRAIMDFAKIDGLTAIVVLRLANWCR
jgi:hypothetical protein